MGDALQEVVDVVRLASGSDVTASSQFEDTHQFSRLINL
jgi:hypothetical protein